MADVLSPQDLDLVTRTVLSEAGDQGADGMAAVANVIRNRVLSGQFGKTPSDVVLAPHQFSAWGLPRSNQNHPSQFSTRDTGYQQAASIVNSVWSGQTPDITGGADHFLDPSLVKKTPDWAKGNPTAKIGAHVFYAPNGPVVPDLLGSWGTPATPSAPTPTAASAAMEPPDLLGQWKGAEPDVTAGTQSPLRITIHPPLPPGQDETLPEYTNRLLAENQGNTFGQALIRLGAGGMRGLGDIADTVAIGIASAGRGGANILQGAGILSPQTAGTVGNWAQGVTDQIAADRNAFDVAAANSPAAQTGRIGGQVIGTAPILAASAGLIPGAATAAMAGRPVLGALAAGAGGGAGAAALTSSASDQPFGEQVLTGGAAGAALGPISYGASVVGRGLRNMVFGAVDPETAVLAHTAQGYGINVAPGQMAGTPLTRIANSLLARFPFTGYARQNATQQTAFNRAIAHTFGEDAGAITHDVIDRAEDRIGSAFDDVAQRTGSIPIDRQFIGDVTRIGSDARAATAPIDGLIDHVVSGVDRSTGTIDAQTYQNLTHKGAPLSRAQKSADPNIRFYAGQLRGALDDLMERHTPADVVDDLRNARAQWKALKTIEPLADKAPTGDISPALLQGAANRSYTYGRATDLRQLGRIGQAFLKPTPTSNTAEHLALMAGLRYGAGALGLGGAYYFDPEGFQRDVGLAGLGLLLTRGAGGLMRNQVLARSMIRSGLGQTFAPSPAFLAAAAPVPALTYRQANGLSGQ